MAERRCPACNQLQPATAQGDKCLYCRAELPPVETEAAEAVPEAAPAAEAPAPELEAAAPVEPPATAQPAAEAPVPEGKRKCPNCGEILYETEKRCWRCGHEIEPPAAAAAPAAAPPTVAPTAPPVLPPTVAVPPVAAPTAAAPPYVVPTVPAVPPVDPAAQNLGIWALVVGLLSWFCCPIVGSIVAIVLGVRAKNRGVTGLGIAGIALGIISLIGGLIFGALFVIGLIVGESKTPIPEATSWHWSLQWMLS
jgi:hypothetical protein